jgi:hypothetical protein
MDINLGVGHAELLHLALGNQELVRNREWLREPPQPPA